MLDLVFSGGTVVDGSGAPGRRADVGVEAGRISVVGDLAAVEAKERVDASGQVVAPGFIDMHTHSDYSLLISPRAESKVHQGVTTEVVGNCGFSPAPVSDESADDVRKLSAFLANGVADLDWRWRTFADFLERLECGGTAVNVVPLVGHVPVRATGMGLEHRPATAAELAAMSRLVEEAMEAGAFGLSTGLVYPPSSYAETDEIVDLAKVVARAGGLYFSHIRNQDAGLLRSTAEAIEIGERAGLPVQIAHHKATFRPYYGRVGDAIQLSEWANARGQDVSFDVYPYTAASSTLTQIIPQWAHEGGRERLLARLRDATESERIRADVEAQQREWDQTFVTWVSTADNKPLEGMSVAAIAERRGVDPISALFAILLEENTHAAMVHVCMSEDDVRTVITHPLATIGSDGLALSPTGPLGEGKPHPRNYGTFPRVFQVYVREQGALTLEQAVNKMTGATARKLGLRRKGLIQKDYDADLVVFDPATIRERGTYADPHQFPEGISYVIVNGEVVVRDGKQTDALPGVVLRRN